MSMCKRKPYLLTFLNREFWLFLVALLVFRSAVLAQSCPQDPGCSATVGTLIVNGIGPDPYERTLNVSGFGIKLGLERNGGGRLLIVNNPNDNRIWLEGYSSDGGGSATEMLITGGGGATLPQLSFLVDKIYTSGNVGIGTTSPQGSLHVIAPIGVTFQGDQSAIRHLDSAGNVKFLTGLRSDVSGINDFTFYSYGGNWLFPNGKAGIGTQNPNTNLHVAGNAGVLSLEGQDHLYMNWYPRGVAAGRQAWVGFGGAGTNDFSITNEIASGHILLSPGGNVGIGTANPTAKLHVEGSFTATGPKCALVETASYGKRQLYAMESPENWFEDVGSAQLVDGHAVIKLDPMFAETVNAEKAYHVFLTPQGDCEGLYVGNKTGASFEVRELKKGKSNTPFDYRIVVKRKGYEDVRLAEVKEAKETRVSEMRLAAAAQ